MLQRAIQEEGGVPMMCRVALTAVQITAVQIILPHQSLSTSQLSQYPNQASSSSSSQSYFSLGCRPKAGTSCEFLGIQGQGQGQGALDLTVAVVVERLLEEALAHIAPDRHM